MLTILRVYEGTIATFLNLIYTMACQVTRIYLSFCEFMNGPTDESLYLAIGYEASDESNLFPVLLLSVMKMHNMCEDLFCDKH